jgi:hypothetical protein
LEELKEHKYKFAGKALQDKNNFYIYRIEDDTNFKIEFPKEEVFPFHAATVSLPTSPEDDLGKFLVIGGEILNLDTLHTSYQNQLMQITFNDKDQSFTTLIMSPLPMAKAEFGVCHDELWVYCVGGNSDNELV